jgi:anti-sigma regulatory factor (Ser/Thr protein kinase)
MSNSASAVTRLPTFRHEALFYAGDDEFLQGTVPFILEGLAQHEPVLVVVSEPKIAALRSALDCKANSVQFANMCQVGRNPARIIPAWRDFVNRNGGGLRKLRGIGEPVTADRSEAALSEWHRHESLLNLAFEDSGDWWLLCPYDTASLPSDVVDHAHRNHPFLLEDGDHRTSASAIDLDEIRAPFDEPLADPPADVPEFVFDTRGLAALRVLVRQLGTDAGFCETRIEDLVLAANEIATNSVRHGGGRGVLRVWTSGHTVVCDIRDAGQIDEPLVGRRRPLPDQIGGRGMWLVNQLCELVQVRSSAAGTIVRLHIERS